MKTFKQFIFEGPLSSIPAQKGLKRNFFHGNYGGFGNRGGAPTDKLDAVFQKHDVGYHYSKSPQDKVKHDRSLVRATKQLRTDKSLPLSTRAKAGAANLYFRGKLALQRESEARIPRKEGQPAGSKQHIVIYTQMKTFKQFSEQETKLRTAKGAVYETDVYGAKGYHSKCLEPNCQWKSKSYNRINNAQEAIKKHHREEHFKND